MGEDKDKGKAPEKSSSSPHGSAVVLAAPLSSFRLAVQQGRAAKPSPANPGAILVAEDTPSLQKVVTVLPPPPPAPAKLVRGGGGGGGWKRGNFGGERSEFQKGGHFFPRRNMPRLSVCGVCLFGLAPEGQGGP